jgi:hypothetical protein
MFDRRFTTNDIVCNQEETENYYIDFIPGSAILFVTFESMSTRDIQSNSDRLAWGARALCSRGFAVLGIKPKQNCWYRRSDLYATLERLRDEGFFASYSKVVFYGSSMGGYAALAFCGLAKQSIVLTFNPQTTLNIQLVPWEVRFGQGKGEDWAGAYADAGAEADKAAEVWACYDPLYRLDKLHIDRLPRHNLRELKLPGVGHEMPAHFHKLGFLHTVLDGVVQGDLELEEFCKLARRRRHYGPYYSRLGQKIKNNDIRKKFLDLALSFTDDLGNPDIVQFQDYPEAQLRIGCNSCGKAWNIDLPRQINLLGDLRLVDFVPKIRARCMIENSLPSCEAKRVV